MRIAPILFWILAIPTVAGFGGRARAETVDLALVLVVDVSRSIDDQEFKLQRQGYAAAFTNPEVIAAIHSGPTGNVAVAYIEFAGANQVKTVIDWRVLHDTETASRFAAELAEAPRSFAGFTAISAAVDFAAELLAPDQLTANNLITERRAMDVSGDGTNNAGRDVATARDDAVAAGIVINGLAIINERPAGYAFAHVQPPEGLQEYYRRNVIGGPGSFVVAVKDFTTFTEAITRKLVSEIASNSPPPGSGAAQKAAAR